MRATDREEDPFLAVGVSGARRRRRRAPSFDGLHSAALPPPWEGSPPEPERNPMSLVPFHELPGQSRLWVFPASRPLSPEEGTRLLTGVDRFLEEWDAHGSPLRAAREWREGSFLLVAVDEASAPPSGCSVDALANLLKKLGEGIGAEFLDHAPVWYREGTGVRKVSREAFRAMAGKGTVTLDTPVFDHTITRLGHLRDGGWEKPAGASWHRRAFFPSG